MTIATAEIDTTAECKRLSSTIGGGIHSVYQPIVRLSDGRTIAYEALARGPRGSHLERPDRLFAAARAMGLEVALDWQCRRAALDGALAAGLDGDRALFVNLEPVSAGTRAPAGMEEVLERALERFDVIVELTERALTTRPTELLRLVDQLRDQGMRIALDDVGADPRSLALMPFLSPEVIKLDLRLMQQSPSREIAEVVHAVNAEAERTGALVLAEGIETEDHRRRALALGATYGQGWLFGRPGELPVASGGSAGEPRQAHRPRPPRSPQTPFEVVAAARTPRRGDKWLLLELSRAIEAQTANQGAAAVVLSTFQEAPYFTPATARRYASLADDAALVAALGVGLPSEPAPGVRGVSLNAAEPLRGEWDVTVLGPHFSAAFVARDLGDTGADFERRFDFALTYDRELVTRAARAMMQRIAADERRAPSPPPTLGASALRPADARAGRRALPAPAPRRR
jgi:EAL domain-containing protein (putative c-di-GMP-specific phosphodiesterase class I)